MFPMVTGKRFPMRKFSKFRVRNNRRRYYAICVQKLSEAPALISSPAGMKYILATLCSNPHATNAVIGGKNGDYFISHRAPAKAHPDRQTNQHIAQNAEREQPARNPRLAFVSAIASAVAPTAESSEKMLPAKKIKSAAPPAPIKLPR
jgi:hypothetical protein